MEAEQSKLSANNQALHKENQLLKQSLLMSEERFELVCNATNEVIWDWNLISNKVWWNEGFKAMFGYRTEDLEPGIESWYSRIHPDDLDRIMEEIHALLERGEKQWSGEYHFRKADGSYVLVLDRGYAQLDAQGKPYRMLGCMQDITQRKRSEQALLDSRQQFQMLSEAVPQIIWTTNPEGYVNYFNRQWYSYTGLTIEESLGQSWIKAIHEGDVQSLLKHWEQALLTGKIYEVETRVKRADGVYRWFLVRALPLKDEQGKVKQWFGTNTEIHEQKLLAEQLKAMTEQLATANQELKTTNQDLAGVNERLAQTNEELDQYVYKVSHDIRSPVASILGLLGLINKESLPQEVQEYLRLIENRIYRLDDFISSVLTHSRNINTPPKIIPIDFNKIIDQCLEELEYYPDHAKLRVEKVLPDSGAFWGDELRLVIVFKNLISNAIKYRNRHVDSFLAIRVTLMEGTAVMVLQDNGQGIPAHYQEKVFAMFFRATEKGAGSGLGLYIVKQAVERMGGDITLESQVGMGTTFTIKLPNRGKVENLH